MKEHVERMQDLEAELRRVEEKYVLTLKSSHDGIVLADPKSGRILEVNDAFASMVERTRRDLLALHIDELPWKEGFRSFKERFKKINHDGPLVLRKVALDRGEASVQWLDINASLTPGKGRTEVQLFFRDVTQEIEGKKKRT